MEPDEAAPAFLSVRGEAAALLIALATERRRRLADRETRASDSDLDLVGAMLHAIMSGQHSDDGTSLYGFIGNVVSSHWVLDADLAVRLVRFDESLRVLDEDEARERMSRSLRGLDSETRERLVQAIRASEKRRSGVGG